MELRPIRFISEPVEALFDQPPELEKNPGCPQGFTWRGQSYRVVELLGEWRDYARRGHMARNMRPTHSEKAARRGSWGVGKLYFRVFTDSGQIFDLYYDRAPKDVDRRKGEWFLFQELQRD